MRKPLREWIGQRIREARESAGYDNQAAFADAIGAQQATVSRWENGHFEPDAEHLEIISKLTRKPLSFFSPVEKARSRNDVLADIIAALSSASEGTLIDCLDLLESRASRSTAKPQRKA